MTGSLKNPIMKEPIIFNDLILIVNNFWSIVTNICSEWNSVSVKVNHSGFLYFDTIARRDVLGCTADFFCYLTFYYHMQAALKVRTAVQHLKHNSML